ncbi:hypothetical protein DPEC_G00297010 [Dallia pectoralis]|uniref:Uncharacterized protein n=1 Tax=Dallia pectoralis TaxID=75939 RepID=A0ACC2FFK9_DALPE|nr:hypothetical protein DPEC_G00297010 [Dallia pectoralis]
MPKYCSAPNCNHDSGSTNSDRKSFYKFPLQDPDRLKLWLQNMGREDWTPSRHQYICNEHFVTSCFQMRWGIRYLENNAVPTVFQLNEKRKGDDHSGIQNPKRLRGSRKSQDSRSDTTAESLHGSASTLTLYEVTVEHLQAENPDQQEGRGTTGNSRDITYTADALPLSTTEEECHNMAGAGFPVTLYRAVKVLGGLEAGGTYGGIEENVDGEVVVMVPEPQVVLRGLPTAVLAEASDLATVDDNDHFMAPTSLVVENVSPEVMGTELSVSQDDRGDGAQVIAYFETIPNVVSCGAAQFSISPDTVLSTALSPTPIVSTLPIVSKHTPPAPGSLVLTLERLETVGEEAEGDTPEEEDVEQQGSQLEEHRYHKNSLSKEQLEAIVLELQKKVKVLQQRHRRHLDKLLGLENTVSQLRQSNLLNEERLQLLERAYIQTSAAVSEAGETVAIIYGGDNTTYIYEG